MVPDPQVLENRAPCNQVLSFRPETVLHDLIELANPRLLIKPGLGDKPVRAVVEMQFVIEFSALAKKICVEQWASVIGSILKLSCARNTLEIGDPVVAE